MNGVHDMGGMHGMGPIAPEADEPVFHHAWEARVHALTLASPTRGNIDAGRHRLELLPPAEYLRMSYYEKWLTRLEQLLVAGGHVTAEELAGGKADPKAPRATPVRPAGTVHAALTGPYSYIRETGPAAFAVGDKVRAKTLNPTGHTRLPRYVRGRVGVVERLHGAHVLPDSNAHDLGEDPRHLYGVRFDAQEIWGPEARAGDGVGLDLWEPYLERA
ncbi:nitrile hydratase subunit beta [Phenylobacterium sp.]|uniref:nitrile hydratase subunit beta n=1 Tax=Phenylobacterium sp. TaxID=1871053 RepID=UPI0025EE2AD3|nr:nitrile hydratase subunit beta [Phenylobacterium sp.]MBX3483509.1 nitrile hydratase subunit beta [Phenylobacterium sp.]MCW5759539.1 nitrile hydratase subunit beta [Phenylobacterium sp.]